MVVIESLFFHLRCLSGAFTSISLERKKEKTLIFQFCFVFCFLRFELFLKMACCFSDTWQTSRKCENEPKIENKGPLSETHLHFR